jgi:DNA-directed RNA polymerase subunit RPC12/RpoP
MTVWFRCAACSYRVPVSGPADKVDLSKYSPVACGKCGVSGQFKMEKKVA